MCLSLDAVLRNFTLEPTMKPSLNKTLLEWVGPERVDYTIKRIRSTTGKRVTEGYRPTALELVSVHCADEIGAYVAAQPHYELSVVRAMAAFARRMHRESGIRSADVVKALNYAALFIRNQGATEYVHTHGVQLQRKLEAQLAAPAKMKQPRLEAVTSASILLDTVNTLLAGGNACKDNLALLANEFRYAARSRVNVLYSLVEEALCSPIPWFGIQAPRTVVTLGAGGNMLALTAAGTVSTLVDEGSYGTTPHPNGWYASAHRFVPGTLYLAWASLLRAKPGNLDLREWVTAPLRGLPTLWEVDKTPVAWIESEAVIDRLKLLRSIPPDFYDLLPAECWTISADTLVGETTITSYDRWRGKDVERTVRTWTIVDGKSTVPMRAIAGSAKAYTGRMHYTGSGWTMASDADRTAKQVTNAQTALVCQRAGGFGVKTMDGSGWYETATWIGVDRADNAVTFNK
jgi:hypothetical protein